MLLVWQIVDGSAGLLRKVPRASSKSKETDLLTNNRPFVVTTIISAVLLGAVLLLHMWKDIPIIRLTGDPGDFVPIYTGFLSQAGVLFWSASASICIFCGTATPESVVDSSFRRFLLVSGVFTLFLTLDDMFLLHEKVLPYFGIPQIFVLGSYVFVTLAYLLVFRQIILDTNYRLLVVSLFFFAVSIALDVFKPFDYYLHFFEDGAKLVGIVNWAAYLISVGKCALNSAPEEIGNAES